MVGVEGKLERFRTLKSVDGEGVDPAESKTELGVRIGLEGDTSFGEPLDGVAEGG